ncbi:hypothetical protein AQ490_16910 [Wenjunlia vitaminophila]|uniref:Uncharacterized protein n=1 Tax=Wenjunlia vitaminophila TaxID=76728 RepID=A0A0T6LVT1_WENVI|nr:DUF5304 family protein [Wenjunlia vitaminophila]KRV50097.1 hypothetical protein AQ490_16910 [Wenjunlia vitaminophila]
MSESPLSPDPSASEKSTGAPQPDDDAWSTACAEDMAEQASKRRVNQAYQPGSAADELRKLAGAVADRVQELGTPLGLPTQLLVHQAKSMFDQAKGRNPELFDHLAAAGNELLAAYRAAVTDQERRWTDGPPPRSEDIDLD